MIDDNSELTEAIQTDELNEKEKVDADEKVEIADKVEKVDDAEKVAKAENVGEVEEMVADEKTEASDENNKDDVAIDKKVVTEEVVAEQADEVVEVEKENEKSAIEEVSTKNDAEPEAEIEERKENIEALTPTAEQTAVVQANEIPEVKEDASTQEHNVQTEMVEELGNPEEVENEVAEVVTEVQVDNEPADATDDAQVAKQVTEDVAVDGADEKAADTSEKIAVEVIENDTQEVADEVVEESVKEASGAPEEVTEVATEDIKEDVSEKVIEEVTQEVTQEVAEEVTETVVEAVTQEVAEEVTVEVSEVVNDLVDKMTEEVTEDATSNDLKEPEETETGEENVEEVEVKSIEPTESETATTSSENDSSVFNKLEKDSIAPIAQSTPKSPMYMDDSLGVLTEVRTVDASELTHLVDTSEVDRQKALVTSSVTSHQMPDKLLDSTGVSASPSADLTDQTGSGGVIGDDERDIAIPHDSGNDSFATDKQNDSSDITPVAEAEKIAILDSQNILTVSNDISPTEMSEKSPVDSESNMTDTVSAVTVVTLNEQTLDEDKVDSGITDIAGNDDHDPASVIDNEIAPRKTDEKVCEEVTEEVTEDVTGEVNEEVVHEVVHEVAEVDEKVTEDQTATEGDMDSNIEIDEQKETEVTSVEPAAQGEVTAEDTKLDSEVATQEVSEVLTEETPLEETATAPQEADTDEIKEVVESVIDNADPSVDDASVNGETTIAADESDAGDKISEAENQDENANEDAVVIVTETENEPSAADEVAVEIAAEIVNEGDEKGSEVHDSSNPDGSYESEQDSPKDIESIGESHEAHEQCVEEPELIQAVEPEVTVKTCEVTEAAAESVEETASVEATETSTVTETDDVTEDDTVVIVSQNVTEETGITNSESYEMVDRVSALEESHDDTNEEFVITNGADEVTTTDGTDIRSTCQSAATASTTTVDDVTIVDDVSNMSDDDTIVPEVDNNTDVTDDVTENSFALTESITIIDENSVVNLQETDAETPEGATPADKTEDQAGVVTEDTAEDEPEGESYDQPEDAAIDDVVVTENETKNGTDLVSNIEKCDDVEYSRLEQSDLIGNSIGFHRFKPAPWYTLTRVFQNVP